MLLFKMALTYLPTSLLIHKYVPLLPGKQFLNIFATNAIVAPVVVCGLPLVVYLGRNYASPLAKKKLKLNAKIWLTTGAIYSLLYFRPIFGPRHDWLTLRLLMARVDYQASMLHVKFFGTPAIGDVMQKRHLMLYSRNFLRTYRRLAEEIPILFDTNDVANVCPELPNVLDTLETLAVMLSETYVLAARLEKMERNLNRRYHQGSSESL